MTGGHPPPLPQSERRKSSTAASSTVGRFWPDYRTVWRWHFYAGLFCIPFVLLLSVTGVIYLFKPQIDALIDRPFDRLKIAGPPATAAAEVQAALDSEPGSTLVAYELPQTPASAARVVVLQGSDAIRVYVHPVTLRILKRVPEEGRFERLIFNLHGQLLLGNAGSVFMELVASWAIVMILTGLYLGWPREGRLAGLLYPRLRASRRIFWRDLHAVTGVWVSLLVLFLLLSGMPWSYAWGNYLAALQAMLGGPQAEQAWTIGHVPVQVELAGGSGGGTAMSGMPDMAGMNGASPARGGARPDGYAPLDTIVRRVRPLALAYPVMITPPAAGQTEWTARSDAQNRTLRTSIRYAPGGELVKRVDFDRHGLVDRIVGFVVAAHEGQLFGWLNTCLNLLAATGMLLVGTSAVVMWWRRRPTGVLGAPTALATVRVSAPFLAVMALLALLLPELGAAMILVWLMERLFLRRSKAVSLWLGLPPHGERGA